MIWALIFFVVALVALFGPPLYALWGMWREQRGPKARRWKVVNVKAGEYRMVDTDWGPEPHEPVLVELEPEGEYGWPEPGEFLVTAP